MKITAKLKKAANSYWFNISLIAVITLIVLSVTFKVTNVEDMITLFKNANVFLLGLALFFVFLWQFLVGLGLTLITRITHPKYKVRSGILNTLIAALFHGITPSASGGQIIQVYVYHKQGVELADASSALWFDFVIYQSCLTVVSAIFIIFKFPYFYHEFSSLYFFVLLGFTINTAIIFFMYGFARYEKLHNWMITTGVDLGCKLHLIKNREAIIKRVNLEVTKFRKEVVAAQNHRKTIISVAIIDILRMLVFYSIPLIILLAFGVPLTLKLIVEAIVMASFVSIASGMIPIPGASGGSEAIFVMMFSNLVANNVATGTMLIWRGMTYYLMILVGLGAFIIFRFSKVKEG